MQYDQKKVPTFFAKPEKDTLTIREWIKRIDSMKNSLGWTEEATYHNAINGLFYPANEIVNVHLDVDIHADFVETWTWLKKRLTILFDQNATHGRAYVDILWGIRQKNSIHDDIDLHVSQVYTQFLRIRDMLPDPVVPDQVNYTRQQVIQYCNDMKKKLINEIAWAFMVNTLPGDLRTKVLEKNPETIADTLSEVKKARKLLIDKTRPLDPASKATVHEVGLPMDEEAFAAAFHRQFNKLSMGFKPMGQQPANNSNNKRKNNKKKNQQNQGASNNQANQGRAQDQTKSCTYCNQNGHGALTCFRRKNDKAPCINAKGEAFYPEGENAQPIYRRQPSSNAPNNEANTSNRQDHQPGQDQGRGQDFPGWV